MLLFIKWHSDFPTTMYFTLVYSAQTRNWEDGTVFIWMNCLNLYVLCQGRILLYFFSSCRLKYFCLTGWKEILDNLIWDIGLNVSKFSDLVLSNRDQCLKIQKLLAEQWSLTKTTAEIELISISTWSLVPTKAQDINTDDVKVLFKIRGWGKGWTETSSKLFQNIKSKIFPLPQIQLFEPSQ